MCPSVVMDLFQHYPQIMIKNCAKPFYLHLQINQQDNGKKNANYKLHGSLTHTIIMARVIPSPGVVYDTE